MHHPAIILQYAFCYFVVFMLTWITRLYKSNRLFDSKGISAANINRLVALHFGGILWLGLVPFIIGKKTLNLLLRGSVSASWMLLFVILLAAIIIMGFRESRHIRIKQAPAFIASGKMLTQYFAVRILFLCAYELFFRGFLLFDCIQWFGIPLAIIITTGLTVLIHVFTNKKEMWACVPFGIILSCCCIAIHAVWPAMLLHLALSLAYEVPAVYKFLHLLKPVK